LVFGAEPNGNNFYALSSAFISRSLIPHAFVSVTTHFSVTFSDLLKHHSGWNIAEYSYEGLHL